MITYFQGGKEKAKEVADRNLSPQAIAHELYWDLQLAEKHGTAGAEEKALRMFNIQMVLAGVRTWEMPEDVKTGKIG